MLVKDDKSPKENGQQQSNGIEADSRSERGAASQPDEVDNHRGKSRSTFNSCQASLVLYDYWNFQIRYFI